MNTPRHPEVTLSTRTLLDPWASLRGRLLLGLGIFGGCVLVWMTITGFDTARLTRTGPWELMSMAAVCVSAQLLLGAGLRFLPADPRVASFVVPFALVYLVLVVVSMSTINLLPQWVFSFGGRKVHALNGGMIACLLSPF